MILVGLGDSWMWGAELVDPVEEPVPLFNIPGGEFERHHKPINLKYRLKNRYVNLFQDLIGAEELVDLSKCSISNDTIKRRLLNWLCAEGYLSGKDTSNLFVLIGWTSPERREFYWKDRYGEDNYIHFGPWTMDIKHHPCSTNKHEPELDEFFRLYFDHFWNEKEFIDRWMRQVYETQVLLKSLNIKYVMHQAFYHHHHQMINQWSDDEYKKKIEAVDDQVKNLWELVDPIRFMHKNDHISTAHHYMLSQGTHDEMFIVFHPSIKGHEVWANHLYQYCITHNLL